MIAEYLNEGGMDVDKFYKQYQVTIISKKMDTAIKDLGLQSVMTSDYVWGESPFKDRYYGPKTIGNKNIQPVESFVPGVYSFSKPHDAAGDIMSDKFKQVNDFSVQFNMHKYHLSAAAGTKGVSVWDFDDTLAKTKSGVLAKIPNLDGTHKPNRKVIFLAGTAGSGKSNVVKQLNLKDKGFKIVNSDISLEWLKKNNGLPANMNDLTTKQLSKLGKLQHESRQIAHNEMMGF